MSCSCLCGKFKFEATPKKKTMDACHCSKCRKWTGGVALAVECSDIHIENESELQVYPSSEWGERVFCGTCGSSLIWRMKDQSIKVVMLQAFDDPSQFEFTNQIFIDEKPATYEFANNTGKMTGEEFMKLYAS